MCPFKKETFVSDKAKDLKMNFEPIFIPHDRSCEARNVQQEAATEPGTLVNL